MTTTEAITKSATTDRPCPSWCSGCSPSTEGGYGHFGDEGSIPLSLVAPEKFHSTMQSLDSYIPAQVGIYLEQKHGAYFPVIKVTRGDQDEDVLLTLTLDEAGDLGALLTAMVSDARRAAVDRCDARVRASMAGAWLSATQAVEVAEIRDRVEALVDRCNDLLLTDTEGKEVDAEGKRLPPT